MVSSELDSVEGIGPKKKKSLMLFLGQLKILEILQLRNYCKLKE